jgi:hypothetical protein
MVTAQKKTVRKTITTHAHKANIDKKIVAKNKTTATNAQNRAGIISKIKTHKINGDNIAPKTSQNIFTRMCCIMNTSCLKDSMGRFLCQNAIPIAAWRTKNH